jgi:CHAT domain-containing protein/Tfp pilus assembly protein PilF
VIKKVLPASLILLVLSQVGLPAQIVDDLIARGDSLSKAAQFDSAIAVELRALELAERQFGKVDSTVARVLELLGIAHLYKADFDASIGYLDRALDIRRTVHGARHWTCARCLTYLGVVNFERGVYDRAASLYREALDIYESTGGYEPWRKADCLNSLATTHWINGSYDEAEEAYRQALAIYEESLGTDDPSYAGTLSNLALLCHERGDLAGAEPMYRRAIATYEETRGPGDPDIARMLVNLADLYGELGKFADAEAAFARSIEIRESAFGPDHPDVANSLNGLATLFMQQDRFDEAEPLLTRALGIFEATLGSDAPQLSYPLGNLATVYTHQGRYDLVEACYQRVIAIRESAFGPDHPSVANSLSNMSVFLWTQKRYDEALQCNQRSMTIRLNTLGAMHPRVAENLENAATLNHITGNTDDALRLARGACEVWEDNLRRNGRVLSESDALNYSDLHRHSVSRYLSFYLDAESATLEQRRDVVEAILRSKGQVSDEIFDRQRVIVSEPDEGIRALAQRLEQHKQETSEVFMMAGDIEPELYRAVMDSMTHLIAQEESELAQKSASYRRWRQNRAVSLERVAAGLPAGGALVEYVRFERIELEPDSVYPAYAALVVANGSEPEVVELGRADPIDALVADYRRHFQQIAALGAITDEDGEQYRRLSVSLHEAVWAPVSDHVSGAELVVVCPDAALNLVSFAGLANGDGRYLVEEYAIHYLSSGRDVIRLADPPAAGRDLLAMGDPDYDADTQAARLTHKRVALRSGVPDCDDFRNVILQPLPGTRDEIERVAQGWKSGSKLVLLGREASEAGFKTSAPGKRAIHLATHGYYMTERCSADRDGTEAVADNPLLLSGLFLAGANRRLDRSASDESEDGVLTALEVSGVDLEGCALVVLSACETGLGKAEDGEGVYGLRRAFQTAGARTVVSALWEVSDEDAAQFVGRLYQNQKQDLPRRIRALQLQSIASARSDDRSDHPFSWAAFVAQGDWR